MSANSDACGVAVLASHMLSKNFLHPNDYHKANIRHKSVAIVEQAKASEACNSGPFTGQMTRKQD